jgi:hypothetical protein
MAWTMQNYRRFRWAGRLTGFLGLVFFISFFIGQGLPVLKVAKSSYDLLFILTLISLSLVTYFIGWFIEIVSGVLLTFIGIILGTYIAYSSVFHEIDFFLIFTLPFIIPGLLLIYAWIIKVKRKKNPA